MQLSFFNRQPFFSFSLACKFAWWIHIDCSSHDGFTDCRPSSIYLPLSLKIVVYYTVKYVKISIKPKISCFSEIYICSSTFWWLSRGTVKHSHCQTQPLSNTTIVKHSHCQTQPLSNTAIVKHSHCQTQPLSNTAIVKHSHCQTQPLSNTAIVKHSHCQTQPFST